MGRIGAVRNRIKAVPGLGYVVAGLLVVCSLGLRLLIEPHDSDLPFMTFLPAVAVATCLGGRWPGTVSVLLSAYLGWQFLFAPKAELLFPWQSRVVATAAFVVLTLVMVWLIDGLWVSYERAKQAEASRETLLKTLEHHVTERTRELSQANAQLRDEIASRQSAEMKIAQYERLEAVGQLVGGISHDFNNLLSIVVGNLDLAQRRLARNDANITHHLDAAMDGARRGATLTRRLLAFARKQPLQPVVTDINALVAGMVTLLGSTLGEHIAIDLQLGDSIWPSKIDPSQLENAILNLAVNARDAMPAGGHLTVTTMNADIDEAAADPASDIGPGQYAVVVVSDSGAGMTDEVRHRAFEPFFTTKGVGHGTGLGLSQIHGYLKQSGGHVALSSTPDVGTSVSLYLPRHAEALDRLPEGVSRPAATVSGPGKTILVVEDEDGVRAVTAQFLRDLAFNVREAASGASALQVLAEHADVDLLFTDVIMPGMLGPELAAKAVALRPHLKVVYTSGYPDTALVRDGRLPPDIEMIHKPFTPEDLASKLERVLSV